MFPRHNSEVRTFHHLQTNTSHNEMFVWDCTTTFITVKRSLWIARWWISRGWVVRWRITCYGVPLVGLRWITIGLSIGLSVCLRCISNWGRNWLINAWHLLNRGHCHHRLWPKHAVSFVHFNLVLCLKNLPS